MGFLLITSEHFIDNFMMETPGILEEEKNTMEAPGPFLKTTIKKLSMEAPGIF
jgi:hypothetical protein